MFRYLVLFLLLTSAQISMAYECQQNEAQIIAKLETRKTDSLTYCVGFIDVKSIEFYNPSQICPLDIDEVVAKGISFPLQNGHDCEVYSGDTVTGILVQKASGAIVLE